MHAIGFLPIGAGNQGDAGHEVGTGPVDVAASQTTGLFSSRASALVPRMRDFGGTSGTKLYPLERILKING